MADQVDTLSIGVELALANARRDYEALKREIESSPFKIDVALNGTKPEGRTFGGASAMIGPENYRRPDPVPQRPSMAQAIDAAMVQRNVLGGSIGGSGFGAAVGPLPTAAVNSVYGGVSPGVALSMADAAAVSSHTKSFSSRTSVAHTDREYGSYRVRAVRSGIMDPMSRAAFDQEGGFQQAMSEIDFWNEQRARNRSDAAMQRAELLTQPFHGPGYNPDGSRGRRPGTASGTQSAVDPTGPGMFPNFRNALTAYAGIQMAGGIFASQNQLAYAQIEAMGDLAAFARANIDNNPLANFVGSIPLGIGGGIVSAADYISGGRIDATRTLAASRLQDSVTGTLRQIGDAKRVADMTAQYAGASAVGGFSAQMASFAMQKAMIEPNRQLRAAELKSSLFSEVEAKKQELARAALPSSLVADSAAWFGESVSTADLPRRADGTLDTSSIKFPLSSYSQSRVDQFNAATIALNQARERMNSADASTKAVAEQEVKALETSQRIAIKFDTLAGQRVRNESAYAGYAASDRLRGFTGFSTIEGVLAQFNPRIAELQGQISTIREEGGVVSKEQEAQLEALIKQRGFAGREAMTGYARGAIQELGSYRAGALGLAFDPFGAQRAQVEANFKARTTVVNADGSTGTIDTTSEEWAKAQTERTLRLAQIAQEERIQRRAIGLSQSTRDRVLDYQFQFSYAGAQAAEIYGGTLAQMRELARGGFGTEAESARQLGLKQMDLLKRDTALAFRGEQFDFQNMMIDELRDAKNPGEIFADITRERNLLAGADAAPDKDTETAKSVTDAVGSLERNLENIIKAAMEGLLAN